jgi:hypothetical protein
MVTWERAWKAAWTWLAWSLIWGFAGITLVAIGFFVILDSSNNLATLFLGSSASYATELMGGLTLVVIGWIILGLSAIASFFKINSEVIDQEIYHARDFDAVLIENDKLTCLLCSEHNFTGDAGRIVEHIEQMHNIDIDHQAIKGWNDDFENEAELYLKNKNKK